MKSSVFCSSLRVLLGYDELLSVRPEEDRHRGAGCSRRCRGCRGRRLGRGYCYVRGLRVGVDKVEIGDDGEDEHEGDCCC